MRYWSDRTELPVTRLLDWLGLARSKFYDWRGRYGRANEHNALVPRDFWLEDWERTAIVAYARAHALEGYRRLAFIAAFIEHYNTVRLHSAIGYVAPQDKLQGRAEAIWAERDRKLAEAREARRMRRAEARLHGSTAQLLTPAKETPMIHPAGETDAGSAGEQPARDSRLGCGRKAGAGMSRHKEGEP
jgi:hypothetical protein